MKKVARIRSPYWRKLRTIVLRVRSQCGKEGGLHMGRHMEASNYTIRRVQNRRGKESGTYSGRRMESEGGTRMGDLLKSPRVASLFFSGLPNNMMLFFTRWFMRNCATQATHASEGALNVPFDTHVFGDNQPLCKGMPAGRGEVGGRKGRKWHGLRAPSRGTFELHYSKATKPWREETSKEAARKWRKKREFIARSGGSFELIF